MTDDDQHRPAPSAPSSASFRTSTTHTVVAHVTRDGYQPGLSVVLRGGMWSVEFPEPEAVRFRDWLLLQLPLPCPAPPQPTPEMRLATAKAARAAAWAHHQEKLLKRAWWGDPAAASNLDWPNLIRAVRHVGGLDRPR